MWVGLAWPSMVKTGSVISCPVIGQRRDEPVPPSAASAAGCGPAQYLVRVRVRVRGRVRVRVRVRVRTCPVPD